MRDGEETVRMCMRDIEKAVIFAFFCLICKLKWESVCAVDISSHSISRRGRGSKKWSPGIDSRRRTYVYMRYSVCVYKGDAGRLKSLSLSRGGGGGRGSLALREILYRCLLCAQCTIGEIAFFVAEESSFLETLDTRCVWGRKKCWWDKHLI